MGAQWKHAGRTANAAKKGQIMGKIAKEIAVAAKMGGGDPNGNPRLRAALEVAKKNSMTRDTIDRAIKKGTGQTDETINYELVTYEGFAPHKVPVIVECMTENKNRTASEIRQLFRKGSLGSIGSVSWMFSRMGAIEATHKDKSIDLETVAIEAGAQQVEKAAGEDAPTEGVGAQFLTEIADLDAASKFLTENGWVVTQCELSYVAKNFSELESSQHAEVVDFLNAIDDFDDVHRVYVALK